MPESLTDQISRISSLLRGVSARQGALVKELFDLRAENDSLKKEKEKQEQKIKELEELVYVLKSSISPLDDESKKDFSKRLSEYIRTIDKCIGVLKT